MTKIQNKNANVENLTLVGKVKNEVVQEKTQEIFDDLMRLENINNLSEIILEDIVLEFRNNSFMTEQLELTENQKEKFKGFIQVVVQRAKNRYLAKIKESERTRQIAENVQLNLVLILEELLAGIGQEVNRGALINCVAVAADTKNEKFNKIELQATKEAGDITMPSKCLLISTNCFDIIKNSIVIEIVDKETGEIKNV